MVKRRSFRQVGLLAVSMLATAIWSVNAQAACTIKVGVISTFEGAFAILGPESFRGAELAVNEFGGKAGGCDIELIKGSSDARPDVAIAAARKLIENDNVDILVGPLSGSEGLAMKEYAKTQPNKTFVNGISAAQDTTLREPADNFFRFSGDGAQWQAGLGNYVYDVKGYRRVVTLGEDYSYPYTQVFGFMHEFCGKGGKVVKKFWTPIGAKDYSSVIAAIPDDIDAVYVALCGADPVNFLTQYVEFGGDKPLIGGSCTVGPDVLQVKGRFEDAVVGTIFAGPVAEDSTEPAWVAFNEQYQSSYAADQRWPGASMFAKAYYVNMKAVLLALDEIGGDLSDGQKNMQQTLAKVAFDSPTGPVSLDENRQAILSNFVSEIVRLDGGGIGPKMLQAIPAVTQTLGMDRAEFMKFGPVSRENPSCP